jgi:hypothetical protein
MTTPLAPDTPDLDTFGGTFVNADPVVDPETDMDAAYQNRLTAQVVMLSHAAPRAWARCTVSGGVVTVADHDAVWGTGGGVAPTATYVGPGEYTVAWAASYDDLQATPESHAVSLRCVQASAFRAAAARIVNARLADAVTAEVTAYDAAGAAAEVDQFTVTVW